MSNYDHCMLAVDTSLPPEQGMESIKSAATISGQKVTISFSGFDDDPREVWDIPEIKAWCAKIIQLGGLSWVTGPGDDTMGAFPTQLLLAACAQLGGAVPAGDNRFAFNIQEIQDLEETYRSKE